MVHLQEKRSTATHKSTLYFQETVLIKKDYHDTKLQEVVFPENTNRIVSFLTRNMAQGLRSWKKLLKWTGRKDDNITYAEKKLTIDTTPAEY